MPYPFRAAIVRAVNQRALEHLRADPIMAALIERVGPMKFCPRRLPPFEALTRAIIYQQLHAKAAATILDRFTALFDQKGFPTPQAVLKTPPERLRTAGLSGRKAEYIQGIARHAAHGTVPSLVQCDKMSDGELLDRLTQIKGVGRWTVEMLLIFNLGRPDILPVHDLGVRKGFQLTYQTRRLPEPKRLSRFGVRWAPYRTTAAWYLWRAADGAKVQGNTKA